MINQYIKTNRTEIEDFSVKRNVGACFQLSRMVQVIYEGKLNLNSSCLRNSIMILTCKLSLKINGVESLIA